VNTLRWRAEEVPIPPANAAAVAPVPAAPVTPAEEVPAQARIAQPVTVNPAPAAPMTLDEPAPAKKSFGPDGGVSTGEMVWRTQIGGPVGVSRPLPESAFPPVVTPAPVAPVSAAAPMPGHAPGAAGAPAAGPQGPTQAMPAQGPGAAVVPVATQVTVYKLERPIEFDRRLVMLRDPDSPGAAAYRVLRHRLAERGNPRVVVVTSAKPKEGKSTCAVNLALALGECGRARVLLVEANLRSPRLAEMLAFMPPVCFGEQVAYHRDQPDEPWTVVEAHSPWLHVAAVKPDVRDRPFVDGPAFAIAIDQLRHAGYDYVVIDTPAVLGTADVNLTQDCADGVLFVSRARHTASRHLTRAVDQLQPGKVLGVVLLEL
jgi:Mrp family chromosome partitioning ATPase